MKLATLCYLKRDGQTLMLERGMRPGDIHQGKWNGLGGKFEQGESPEECLIREVKEESGLTILRPELRGVLTFPLFKDDEDWYVFVFTCSEFEGELIDSPEGRLCWIEDKKLAELNLWEGDRYFLRWLDEDAFFSAKLVYQNSCLVSCEAHHYPTLPY